MFVCLVVELHFEKIEIFMYLVYLDWIVWAKCVDPDQTAPQEQNDQVLHFLHGTFYPLVRYLPYPRSVLSNLPLSLFHYWKRSPTQYFLVYLALF